MLISLKTRLCDKAVEVAKLAKAYYSTYMFGVIPSRIKGPGLEYIDLRDYTYGDDPRFIDWRASARLVKPDGDYRLVVREHLLERLVSNVFILDYSSSMDYGDKVETAVYVLTGFLSLAHFLNDLVDLIVLRGDKVIVRKGCDPMDALGFALNTICNVNPWGYVDLGKIGFYLNSMKNRRTVFVITDYAHQPSEISLLIDAARGLNMKPIFTLVTTKIESEKPDVNGLFNVIDLEHPGKRVVEELDVFYRAVAEHMKRIEIELMRKNVKFAVFKGLKQARYRRHLIIRLYAETRARTG